MYRTETWSEQSFWQRLKISLRVITREKLGAILAARRMKIRDRGVLVASSSGSLGPRLVVHGGITTETEGIFECPAFLRLGKRGSTTIVWCWRCEDVLYQDSPTSNFEDYLQTLGIAPPPEE